MTPQHPRVTLNPTSKFDPKQDSIMTTVTGAITQELINQVAYETNKRAAITVPQDGLTAFGEAFQRAALAHQLLLGSLQEGATVHVEALAGDVVGMLAGQVHRHGGDLGWPSEALDGGRLVDAKIEEQAFGTHVEAEH